MRSPVVSTESAREKLRDLETYVPEMTDEFYDVWHQVGAEAHTELLPQGFVNLATRVIREEYNGCGEIYGSLMSTIPQVAAAVFDDQNFIAEVRRDYGRTFHYDFPALD